MPRVAAQDDVVTSGFWVVSRGIALDKCFSRNPAAHLGDSIDRGRRDCKPADTLGGGDQCTDVCVVGECWMGYVGQYQI